MKSFLVRGMQQCQDYDISVMSLCVARATNRTESEKSLVTLTTLPEKVKNLKLDHAHPNSLSLKWDSPRLALNLKFKLTISGQTAYHDVADEGGVEAEGEDVAGGADTTDATIDIEKFRSTVEVPGDKSEFTISKLPDIVGTGHAYKVSIVAVVITHRENEVVSPEVTER